MGFGLIIGFIDHLQIVTASNYNAIANSHTVHWDSAVGIANAYGLDDRGVGVRVPVG
jgi:glutamine synthetase